MGQASRSIWATRVMGVMMVAAVCGCAQQAPQKPYECVRANTPITIDGRIDQAEWAQAKVLDFVIAGTETPTTHRVEGRIMWDESCLYVAMRACDEDVWSIFTERDATTCQEDVLEVFLVPNPGERIYYSFEINATGVVYDAMAAGLFSGGALLHRWRAWNCDGLKVATSVEGTLNDYTDRDRGRSLEMAIPFASLPTLKGKAPSPGDRWKFNLAGYDYSVYLKGEVESFTCSRLTAVDFHRTADFMTMVFVHIDRQ